MSLINTTKAAAPAAAGEAWGWGCLLFTGSWSCAAARSGWIAWWIRVAPSPSASPVPQHYKILDAVLFFSKKKSAGFSIMENRRFNRFLYSSLSHQTPSRISPAHRRIPQPFRLSRSFPDHRTAGLPWKIHVRSHRRSPGGPMWSLNFLPSGCIRSQP